MSKEEFCCKINSVKMLNSDTVYLGIECAEIANSAIPGQFVNISCGKFLKRPFGIASVDKDNGLFYIGVKVVGEGTKNISGFKAGDEVSVLGPLGNGFDLEGVDKAILVSGGTGVFPVNFLSEYLKGTDVEYKVVQGFRNKDQVILNDPSYVLTTDAGDVGIKGTCIRGLDSIEASMTDGATVFCVGPIVMMKAVGQWAASKGLKCFVSMEQRMACGIGICLCCIVKVKADNEDGYYNKRCCKDGPVF
nr:dihydroorotate dehydrogenase electron transfer subunit [Saccharofermentans sp.]